MLIFGLNFFSFFRFSDLLIGAPRAFNRDEGRVFVYINNKNVSCVPFFISPKVYLCVRPSSNAVLVRSSIRPTVFLCVCLSIHTSHTAVCLSVHSSACFSFCLSICLSVCPSVFLLINALPSSCSKLSLSVTQKKNPVVFSILGCTQSSRRSWFNG